MLPSINVVLSKMQKALDFFKNDLVMIRTGRATPALIENVKVKVYGGAQEMRIAELGTITTLDVKTLVIAPYDKSILEEISKGIMAANIGLTPVVDGEIIRISLPSLSEERRQEYVKLLKQKTEAARIAIRQIRREQMADIRRAFEAEEIAEDEKKFQEKSLQDLTDKMNSYIEEISQTKEKELMAI